MTCIYLPFPSKNPIRLSYPHDAKTSPDGLKVQYLADDLCIVLLIIRGSTDSEL